MRAVDVFSGCGGLTTGLTTAGFRVVAGVEADLAASTVFRLNHPNARLYGDVRNLSANSILVDLNLRPGELGLLAGCPPCQGFSRMRTRNGIWPVKDPRNDLIFELLRLVEGLLPKTIMIENVPGLKGNWRLSKTAARLCELGYWWACDVVDARYYGVPQRRKRMILLASRLGPVEIPVGNSVVKTVRDAIGGLPPPEISRKPLHRLLARHSAEVRRKIARIPQDGGSRGAWGKNDQLPCHQKMSGFKDVYGRMAWEDVAPTITRYCANPSKGRFLHPSQNREISLYEAAILQSFPRSYRFPVSLGREQIASMIGEALPPLMARKQAIYVLRHILANT